ncbi:MAG TPA: TonB-dependent receptor plug domain-containing protein [Steroidobacteraceae bacterium]|nr:TonB-dependent receptor plug domain-containing protein [Steroidobacteraceae bacterium]
MKKLQKQRRSASLVRALILTSTISIGALTPVLAQTDAAQPAAPAATSPESTQAQPAAPAATTPESTQAQPAAPAATSPESTQAQPAAVAAATAESTKPTALEAVVVTGSNLPTAPDEVAVPVSVLGADLIDRAGVNSNVLEVLRKSLPSFAGRSNAGNSNANNNNQNTAGGSQVQLRNLDTLVLVNGRRVATSGINAIGGKNFVDVNQIPAAAIDRIEVLTDGASAIYGSDAIGGVVNIILKSNTEGLEVGSRLGFADGNYNENSVYFVGGADLKGVKVTLTGSVSHTDPLFQNQRPFSSPSPLAGRTAAVPGAVGANGLNPGALLAPGLGSPRDTNPTGTAATAGSVAALIANGTYIPATPKSVQASYDLSPFQTLLLRQDQNSLVATFETDLQSSGKLTAFGDAMLSKTDSFTQFIPIVTSVTVPAGAPYNPLTTAFPQVQVGYTPYPHQFYDTAEGTRVTAGLRGDLWGWNWETAYVYSQSLLTQRQTNLIYKPNLPRAIAGGYDANGNPTAGGKFSLVAPGFSENNGRVLQPALDPFARASGAVPGSLANLFGTEVINAGSRLASIDAKVAGAPFSLPAGKFRVAVGASFRRESLSGQTDPNGLNTGPTAQRWIGGTFADPFSGSRHISAAFAEFRAPLTSPSMELPGVHAFDLIGAARAERYSDAGGSVVPKLGFRWQPVNPQVTVRGTYAKSFTAPTLFALNGPTDTRLVGPGVVQSVFGIAGDQINGEDGNNPKLEPSKAKSYSVGFAISPQALAGLNVTVDFSDIRQQGYPGGIGFTNILQSIDQLGSASPFYNNLGFGNFPGSAGATQPFGTPGSLGAYLRGGGNSLNLYAIDQFRNLGGVKEDSINVSVDYELPAHGLGTFTVGTTGAIFLHYQFQALPGQKFYEYAGTVTNGGTGVQGTVPRVRFYSTLDWKLEKYDVTLGNTFISSVTDIGPGGIVYENSKTLKALPVASYITWDLRAAYTDDTPSSTIRPIKGWAVAMGVNNIANRMPPLAPQAYTDNNADVSTYSPIGRLVYVMGNVKF